MTSFAELLAGDPARVEVLCDDLTRPVRLLAAGETVEVAAELGRQPVLRLLACAPEAGGAARLGVAVERPGAPPLEHTAAVAPDAWTAVELPLGEPGPVTVRMRAGGGTVALADAFVAQRERHAPPAGEPLQILLISVDTLRADALGPYGGPATPALARLAGEADLWRRHYAASWWTKPSHASLLTGEPPDVHGATGVATGIAPGLPTLAERLRAAGLRTHAVVDDIVNLAPRWGFDRGFERYVTWDRGLPAAVRHVATWVDHHRDEPFFLFFHTFEPHSDKRRLPYESPGTNRALLAERLGIPDYGCRRGACGSGLLRGIRNGRVPALPADHRAVPFLYGRGVGYLDEQLGELFDLLRGNGSWDRLWVVVTSDHGEELFDHGGLLHHTVHEEVVRVPLLVKRPGQRSGQVREEPTTALDVAPTLLALAGRRDPALPGRPLGTRGPRDPIVTGYAGKVAVVAGDWKLMVTRPAGERLFALGTDPGERRDVAAAHPQLVETLRAALARQRERDQRRRSALGKPAADLAPLSAEELEQLRALGYL